MGVASANSELALLFYINIKITRDVMDILFNNNFFQDTDDLFGVVFEAIVDGRTIRCHVSGDALQDIDPDGYMENDILRQFESNQGYLHEIAEALIEAGREVNGKLFIRSSDVR